MPLREALAYSSGLLTSLAPGLRAPRCLGQETEDGRLHLWLEDLGGEGDAAWTLDAFARAARSLGRFNGSYLDGSRPVPEHPWLSDRWLRSWLAEAEGALDELERHASHPLVARVYPSEIRAGLRSLWTARDQLLGALDELPHVLSHQDAFHRNLFWRDGELVAVDWAFVGLAPLGAELSPLITASSIFLAVPIPDWPRLERVALDAYVDGLRDAGWSGDAEPIRFSYRATSSLRYGPGMVRLTLPFLLDPATHARAEQLGGIPFTEVVTVFATTARTITSNLSSPLFARFRLG